MAQQIPTGQTGAGAAAQVEDFLTAVWQRVLEIPSVDREANFFALGGDSLNALDVAVAVENELGHPLAVTDLYAHPTIAALTAHLAGQS